MGWGGTRGPGGTELRGNTRKSSGAGYVHHLKCSDSFTDTNECTNLSPGNFLYVQFNNVTYISMKIFNKINEKRKENILQRQCYATI